MSDIASVKTIRFSELPRFTGALQQDTDLVGVVGNTDAYRISLNAVQASFVSYTEDYDDAPTLPTTIGWTDGVIHTWDGQQWGATPRYVSNQADIDAGTRFLLVDKQQSLSEEEVAQGRSNLSIADAVPGGSTGLVTLAADGVALDEAGVVTGSQVYRYIQENVNARVSYKILTDKSKLPVVGVSGVIYLIPQPGTSGTYQQMTWNTETKAYISVGLVAIENITVSPTISETSTNNTAAGSRAVYTLVTDTAATLTAAMDQKDAVVLSAASQKVSDLLTQNVSAVDATHAPSAAAVYAKLENQKSEVEEAADNRFNAKIVDTVSSTDTTHVPTSAAVAAHVAASRTEVLTALPASGEADKLYVVGTRCYVWDTTNYTFKEVGGYIGDPTADILTSTVRPGDSSHAPTSDAVYSHTNKALASILTSDVLGGAGVINKAATPKGVADYVQSKAITADKVRTKWEAAYYTSTTDIPSMNAVYEAIHSIHDITGDLAVTGKVTAGSVAATGAISAASLTTTGAVAAGSVGATGAISVGGAATVNGSTTLNGSLTVNGATLFSNQVTVYGQTKHYNSLLADSGIEVYTGVTDHGYLTVEGDSYFSGPVNIQSDIYYSMSDGSVLPITPEYETVMYSEGEGYYSFVYRPNGVFYIYGFSGNKVVVNTDSIYSKCPGSCRIVWACAGTPYSTLTVQVPTYSKVISLDDKADCIVVDVTNTAGSELVVGYVGGDVATGGGSWSGTNLDLPGYLNVEGASTFSGDVYVGLDSNTSNKLDISNKVYIRSQLFDYYSTADFSGHVTIANGVTINAYSGVKQVLKVDTSGNYLSVYKPMSCQSDLEVYGDLLATGTFCGFSGAAVQERSGVNESYIFNTHITDAAAFYSGTELASVYRSTDPTFSGPGCSAMPAHMYKACYPYQNYSDVSDRMTATSVPLSLMPNKAMFCGSLSSDTTATTLHVAPAYDTLDLFSGTQPLVDHFPETVIMWKGKAQVNMKVYYNQFSSSNYSAATPVYTTSFSALPSSALGYNIVTMMLSPYSYSGFPYEGNDRYGVYYIKSVSRY